MFTEFCTCTLDKKSTRQSKPLFCLAGAIISLGFSKIWINCKDFVLYLSGRYQSAGVKRYFKEDELWLFSKFVFSTAASRSLFSQEISIHCYSYFRGFWSNDLTNAATFKTSKWFFSWTVLPRTDHVTGKEKPARIYWTTLCLVHTTPVEFETESSLWQSIKCFPSKLRRRNSKTQE